MGERKSCFCAPVGDPDGQCDNCAEWEAQQDFEALNAAHAEYGCGFYDCVNHPGCDPGDPGCPAIRAAQTAVGSASLSGETP